MRKWGIFFILLMAIMCTFHSQNQVDMHCQDKAFDQEVRNWLQFSVPVIGVDQLHQAPQDSVLILDAREPEEYAVSHIPGAHYIGYNRWNSDVLRGTDLDRPIVVYCSIGYRSEKIAQKLMKMGYSQVKNLYGSIFEWANQGFPLVDGENKPTQNLHGFNEKWSKWILNPSIHKIW